MIIAIFFVAHWYLSLFTQSFFHHRYAAHQMFSMSRRWEKIFYVLSFIFQGASFLSPYAYGILHRMHHAHADTPKDPHSPLYSKNLFHMMWLTKIRYNRIFLEKVQVPEKYKYNVPQWKWLDKFGDASFVRLGWMLFYIGFYAIFATHWWMFLLLPIHFIMGPFHGAIINWFAHKYGYVNYDLPDTSKNFLPVDFLMWGESYHNNHHYDGTDPNFGKKWYEIDPMYPIIKLFNKLGVISLKKKTRLAKAA